MNKEDPIIIRWLITKNRLINDNLLFIIIERMYLYHSTVIATNAKVRDEPFLIYWVSRPSLQYQLRCV